jgi:membrane protein required for beta-lactamase induction
MLSDSYLFDAGWLFFAALTVVVALVGIAAFGRDFLHWTAHLDPAQQAHSQESTAPGKSRLH